MATKLAHSVAVTGKAYRELVRASEMTGLPIGELASLAVNQFLEEKLAAIRETNRSIVLGALERVTSNNRR